MDASVICDRCRSTAIVVQQIYRLSELDEIALTLGLVDSLEPTLIIDCPKCGIREIQPPSSEQPSPDCD
jgi:hypothetical protein